VISQTGHNDRKIGTWQHQLQKGEQLQQQQQQLQALSHASMLPPGPASVQSQGTETATGAAANPPPPSSSHASILQQTQHEDLTVQA